MFISWRHAVVASLLFFAACGGDNNSNNTTPNNTTANNTTNNTTANNTTANNTTANNTTANNATGAFVGTGTFDGQSYEFNCPTLEFPNILMYVEAIDLHLLNCRSTDDAMQIRIAISGATNGGTVMGEIVSFGSIDGVMHAGTYATSVTNEATIDMVDPGVAISGSFTAEWTAGEAGVPGIGAVPAASCSGTFNAVFP